jgi:hypothetical protein
MGCAKRFVKFCVGIGHLVLVVLAFRVVLGTVRTDQYGDVKARDWTAWAMSYPLGRWIVAGIGVGFIVYTFSQLRTAWKLEPDEELHTHEISKFARSLSCNVGKFGIAARAVVFFIIGCFLILAAWHAHPGEARGSGRRASRAGGAALRLDSFGDRGVGVDRIWGVRAGAGAVSAHSRKVNP